MTHVPLRTAQRGMSLVQLAIVIAVGGIFAIAAVVYGIRYIERAKVANELTAIADLRVKTINYGQRVGTFNNATNASMVALVAQDFFTADMVGGTPAAPTVTNRWGGVVAAGQSVSGDALDFSYSALPQYACTELGGSLDSLARLVVINGTFTKTAGGVTNPTAVASACTASNTNQLVLELPR